jgi:Rrf2 family nitric oxide-sensitive transcriptional repressor
MRLMKPARMINVGAVVRATETDFTVVECFDPENNQCRLSSHCRLQSVLGQAMKSFFAVLDNLTLEDLMVPPASASQIVPGDGYVPLVPGLPRALGAP